MKIRNYTLLVIAMGGLLAGCQKDQEQIDKEIILSASERVIISGNTFVLNGSVDFDYENNTAAFAELVNVNRTAIDSLAQITKIFLIKNDTLYQDGSPKKFNPPDNFTLTSSAENVPLWIVEPPITQMVVEIRVENQRFYVKDADIQFDE